MIIKVLLIAAALGFGVLVMRDSVPGHNLLRRLGGVAAVVVGIVAVLWPMLTTYVANAVGVGRGTDLVLYVLVVVFIYNAVATTQRIHGLERTVTALVRELAISRAIVPEPSAPPPTDRVDGPLNS
jgi:small membrane protein